MLFLDKEYEILVPSYAKPTRFLNRFRKYEKNPWKRNLRKGEDKEDRIKRRTKSMRKKRAEKKKTIKEKKGREEDRKKQ